MIVTFFLVGRCFSEITFVEIGKRLTAPVGLKNGREGFYDCLRAQIPQLSVTDFPAALASGTMGEVALQTLWYTY